MTRRTLTNLKLGAGMLLFGAASANAQYCSSATDNSTQNGPDWGCKSFDWALRYSFTDSARSHGPYLAG